MMVQNFRLTTPFDKTIFKIFKFLIISDVSEHIRFIRKAWLYGMLSFNAFGWADL